MTSADALPAGASGTGASGTGTSGTGASGIGAGLARLLLVAAALAALAFVPAGGGPAIWAALVGIGYAVLAVLLLRRSDPRVGRCHLGTAVALLLVPPLLAAGYPRTGLAVVAGALGLLVPWGLLRIVVPGPVTGAVRAAELVVLGCGAALAVTLVVGNEPAQIVAGCGFLTALLATGWVLFDRTAGRRRRRLLWLALGVSSSVLAVLLFAFATEGLAISTVPAALVVAVLSLLSPLCAGIASIAPDVVDVRAVISTVVVGSVMVTLVVSVFAGVQAGAALLGAAPRTGVLALLVAGMAAGFHPVLVRVRGFVDEVLFGGRPDPVDTLTRLGGQLSAGSTPQEWLDTLRVALGVPAAALRRDGAVLAGSGELDPASAAVTPLRVGSETVGELAVGLPPQQLRLPPATEAVLGLVAGPLAQALRAARLGEQLQESRGRVVAALEDERRRMRRDLHDGLGPTLTGIAYSADAARNLLPPGSDAAAAELVALRADAAEAIAEIRRIVYGLRPRALDELGLLGALAQRLARLRAADGRAMPVTFTGATELPELPAAAEVVAYRVVVEAVTNLARHAGVDRALVRLALDEPGQMTLTITGAGGPADAADIAPWTPGVGLRSMRERIEQIGGVLELAAGPNGGTVRAGIPTRLDLPAP